MIAGNETYIAINEMAVCVNPPKLCRKFTVDSHKILDEASFSNSALITLTYVELKTSSSQGFRL